MKLSVTAADPAGNVTLLVESPVPPADYRTVAGRLLTLPALDGEQVGFLTAPRMGGEVRLEMMGGEFCGNAARCAGLWQARKRGRNGAVSVEMSGCSRLLAIETDGVEAWAEMPLPCATEDVCFGGTDFTAVCFEGIVHLIAESPPLPPETVARLLPEAADRFHLPAAGMMFLHGGLMRPVVYVRDTDTLVWERSCASGSTAVAWRDAQSAPDGVQRLELRQPGGIIRTETARSGGAVRSIRIGGPVTLSAPLTLSIE